MSLAVANRRALRAQRVKDWGRTRNRRNEETHRQKNHSRRGMICYLQLQATRRDLERSFTLANVRRPNSPVPTVPRVPGSGVAKPPAG